MLCASATVIVAVAVALGAQAERFELADVQHDARQEAAKHAHEMKRAAEEEEAEGKAKEERASRERTRKEKAPAVPSGSPKAIARTMVPAGQWSCFDFIITHESGWNVHATNPSSGAYGLGQALPGSKMASAGPDWRNNPRTQLTWVLGYMNSRYGSPCGAMNFWKSHNFY